MTTGILARFSCEEFGFRIDLVKKSRRNDICMIMHARVKSEARCRLVDFYDILNDSILLYHMSLPVYRCLICSINSYKMLLCDD